MGQNVTARPLATTNEQAGLGKGAVREEIASGAAGGAADKPGGASGCTVGVRDCRRTVQTHLVRVETQLSGFVPSIQMITRVNLPSEPTSKKLQLCIFVVPFR